MWYEFTTTWTRKIWGWYKLRFTFTSISTVHFKILMTVYLFPHMLLYLQHFTSQLYKFPYNMKCLYSIIWHNSVATYPAILYTVGKHDNGAWILFPDGFPEVSQCVLGRTLCGNVLSFWSETLQRKRHWRSLVRYSRWHDVALGWRAVS